MRRLDRSFASLALLAAALAAPAVLEGCGPPQVRDSLTLRVEGPGVVEVDFSGQPAGTCDAGSGDCVFTAQRGIATAFSLRARPRDGGEFLQWKVLPHDYESYSTSIFETVAASGTSVVATFVDPTLTPVTTLRFPDRINSPAKSRWEATIQRLPGAAVQRCSSTCKVTSPVGTRYAVGAELKELSPGTSAVEARGWTVTPAGFACPDTVCEFTPSGSVTLNLETVERVALSVWAGGGSGTVTGAGLDCALSGRSQTGTCRVITDPSAEVTFEATPAPGEVFSAWNIVPSTLSCASARCTLTMPTGGGVNATATFVPVGATLRRLDVLGSVLSSGTGAVTSDVGGISCALAGASVGGTCAADLPDGTVVTLSATAASGSSFATWNVQPPPLVPCAAGVASCAVTLTADTTVTAAFDRLPPVRVSVEGTATAGSGRVTGDVGSLDCAVSGAAVSGTCQALVQVGSAVTLTAIPASGFTFSGWAFTPASASASCVGASCTVTPAAGVPVVATPTFAPIQVTLRRLDVFGSVLLTGAGTVTSDVGGINCALFGSSVGTGTCGADLPDGTVVTLSATEAAGSSFVSWNIQPPPPVPCAAGARTCAVTLGANTTVTAAFDRLPPVRLVIEGATTSGSGTITSDVGGISCTVSGSTVGTGTCEALLPQGTVVTLTATPDAGSGSPTWDVWSPGAPCAPGATCSVTMNGARTVAAGFALLPTVRLTVDASGMAGFPTGRITSSPAGIDCVPDNYLSPGACTLDVASGTEVTLTATPAAGYAFTGMTFTPTAPACTTSPCAVTVTAATRATATFVPLATRTIRVMTSGTPLTMNNGEAGTIRAIQGGATCDFSVCMAPNHPLNGGGFVPCFCYPLTTETVVLKATANAGYTFSGWDLGCTSVNPARDECTIGPDSSDVTTAGTFTMP